MACSLRMFDPRLSHTPCAVSAVDFDRMGDVPTTNNLKQEEQKLSSSEMTETCQVEIQQKLHHVSDNAYIARKIQHDSILSIIEPVCLEDIQCALPPPTRFKHAPATVRFSDLQPTKCCTSATLKHFVDHNKYKVAHRRAVAKELDETRFTNSTPMNGGLDSTRSRT